MTTNQRAEIRKMVYELVPITKEERDCLKVRKKNEYLRAEYEKLLIKQMKEKAEY